MKYIARIKKKGHPPKAGRVLRKLGECSSLVEAWSKAKVLYPEDEIIEVQPSKKCRASERIVLVPHRATKEVIVHAPID